MLVMCILVYICVGAECIGADVCLDACICVCVSV